MPKIFHQLSFFILIGASVIPLFVEAFTPSNIDDRGPIMMNWIGNKEDRRFWHLRLELPTNNLGSNTQNGYFKERSEISLYSIGWGFFSTPDFDFGVQFSPSRVAFLPVFTSLITQWNAFQFSTIKFSIGAMSSIVGPRRWGIQLLIDDKIRNLDSSFVLQLRNEDRVYQKVLAPKEVGKTIEASLEYDLQILSALVGVDFPLWKDSSYEIGLQAGWESYKVSNLRSENPNPSSFQRKDGTVFVVSFGSSR